MHKYLTLLVSAALLAAQDVPLKNWAAPMYWQPSATEAEASRMRPEIRGSEPRATTPAGSLVFVAMTPCRVVDTRASQNFPSPFGPPTLSPYPPNIRTFPIQSSSNCTIPSVAQAYSFNVTIIPNPLGSSVGYVTIYPTAASPNTPPNAVTLDDITGDIRNNAAIVPAGISNGSVSVVTNANGPDLVIDINGYYAPSAGITLAQGTAAAPSLSFSGDTGTGIFSSGSGVVNFSTAGTNAFSVGGALGNTAIGSGALNLSNSGINNTAAGVSALPKLTTGSANTAYGSYSLFNTLTGTANTAVGSSAGNGGNGNTAVGAGSGTKTSGNNNSALGTNAGSAITTGNNNIDIGHVGSASDDSVIRIGTGGTQTSFFAAGIRGVTLGSSALPVVIDGNGQLGTTPSTKIVFVTQFTYPANLGGQAGANQVCQTEASATGLPGYYVAWLGTSTSSPSSVMSRNGPWAEVNGDTVATTWSALIAATAGANHLQNGIHLDPQNQDLTGFLVWTGSNADGSSTGVNCSNWTATSGSGTYGIIGATDQTWSNSSSTGCQFNERLYCLQQ